LAASYWRVEWYLKRYGSVNIMCYQRTYVSNSQQYNLTWKMFISLCRYGYFLNVRIAFDVSLSSCIFLMVRKIESADASSVLSPTLGLVLAIAPYSEVILLFASSSLTIIIVFFFLFLFSLGITRYIHSIPFARQNQWTPTSRCIRWNSMQFGLSTICNCYKNITLDSHGRRYLVIYVACLLLLSLLPSTPKSPLSK